MQHRRKLKPSRGHGGSAPAAAQAASRIKEEHLAAIFHELRAPLGAILLWSRILRNATLSLTDRREAIGMIEGSALAQAEMIETLLDHSRRIASPSVRRKPTRQAK